jgi:hypothetical protein
MNKKTFLPKKEEVLNAFLISTALNEIEIKIPI